MQSGKETHYEPKRDVILRSACQMSTFAVLGSCTCRADQGQPAASCSKKTSLLVHMHIMSLSRTALP